MAEFLEITNKGERGGAKLPGNPNKSDSLNNWLPITASREAKWWYSTFHNVTAMVGAGVLGLPYSLAALTWIPGSCAIAGAWLVTFYTLWQLVVMHEAVPGKRFDRYPELGRHAFGSKGYWVIMPQQLLVQVASNIVYMVTGGKSLQKFFDLTWPVVGEFRLTYYILFFTCIQLVLSQTPNFNSLKGISLLAAIMSFSYSMVAFGSSIAHGTSHHHHVHQVAHASQSTADNVFGVLNALGTIAFAYAGHSVLLEIQATIPSTPETPSRKPMWKGVVVAYIIVAFCYFSVAVSGFWAFGDLVEDDVLISLERPRWLVAAANFMVFIHVIGSYQVFAMPVFDTLESYLVRRRNFTPGMPLRLIARSTFVVFTALVAICFPFFGGLLGFFGGLVFASTSYIFPCAVFLKLNKPKKFSFHWTVSVISITIGILIAIVGPVGGMRQIVISVGTYKMFS